MLIFRFESSGWSQRSEVRGLLLLGVLKVSAVSLQMFLSVYRSNNEQNVSEVPLTPETLCRDVVEFCREPGEGGCYLAETWRSSGEAPAGPGWRWGTVTSLSCSRPTERMVGEKERMMEVLQQWGQHRAEVRYRLRQHTLPGPGGARAADLLRTRTQVDASAEACLENGVRRRHGDGAVSLEANAGALVEVTV